MTLRLNVTGVASRTGVEISHKPKHPQGCPRMDGYLLADDGKPSNKETK